MKFSYIVASAFTAATVSISVFASPLPQGQNGYDDGSSSASDKAISALLNSIVTGISGVVGFATQKNPKSGQIVEGSAQSTADILKAILEAAKAGVKGINGQASTSETISHVIDVFKHLGKGIAKGVRTGYEGMKDGAGNAKAGVADGVGRAIEVIGEIGSGIAGSFGDNGRSSQQQQDGQPQQNGQPQQGGQPQQNGQDDQDYQDYMRYKQQRDQQGRRGQQRADFWNGWKW
ncbi:hypothetical protein BSLG_008661 [Batrachochytrium salamandrivorans]|nr:hypothetical protein BASA60_006800 [Batrachochytrium salamandrivorans]KAH9244374.1 hypothetical protein BASA81_018221 [Batrachochytrium salamandrivorans]KAH9273342.1 hypothetical protein BASA83_004343 [Batrachochytrium salamandrivorans]KAJ1332357.1 hypothetical protein BSLG_008661 [Batrachochytrium salamandrivorans]